MYKWTMYCPKTKHRLIGYENGQISIDTAFMGLTIEEEEGEEYAKALIQAGQTPDDVF